MALEPSAPLIWNNGWNDSIAISNTWKEHLKKNKHWNDDIASVFIFDEVQMTYGDMGLWNTLFKPISDNPSTLHHHIIIFMSYGSPTRINAPGTPMHIKQPQMVTLVPIDHHDGLEAVGLYLTWPEFEEIINLRKYSFDPACLDFIFRISSGHMGAVIDVINVISCDNVNLIAFIQIRIWCYISVTLENHSIPKNFHCFQFFPTFHCSSPVCRTLGYQCLSERSPWQWVFQIPAVARILHTALCYNVIMDAMFPEEEESAALKWCFAQGWLHADKGVSKGHEIAGYFFLLLLHWLFVEWKLSQNPVNPIQPSSLLEFVIQVVKRFSLLSLSYPRIVGPYYFQTLPEAQYHDEFYRCCYDLTTGSLTTLSEFSTADRRVDFYIPSKKWGVELLRDGQLLEQHRDSNRFFLHWSVWNDSRHWWIHCAWL